MSEQKHFFNAMTALGLLLAVGMASAAFILGVQAKHAVSSQQSITVKGLAEKPVKADRAQWTINIGVVAPTQAETLQAIDRERAVLANFLDLQGLDASMRTVNVQTLGPHYEEEYIHDSPRQVQRGFEGYQSVHISSKDLKKIAAANQAILTLRADNHPVTSQPPEYLVSNLETVKMSLIADATKNARTRATEFVKQDGVKVGVMKSASQGAFYILPATGGEDSDNSYGGIYDKSTVDKIARVVVTVVYNIE